jgi:hypothetical protein
MSYLAFLRRLKHDDSLLGKLFLSARRCHLLFWYLHLGREYMALRLRRTLARSGLHALVVLEVVVKNPRRWWLNGF